MYKSLQATLRAIRKHKLLFIFIVLLQIIFVVSSSALGGYYLLRILEDTQGIIRPLENANYDSAKIEQGQPFTPDYLSIYNSYQSMLRNVLYFGICLALLFLILNSSMWLLSHWMLQDKKSWKIRLQEAKQYFLKAWVSAIVLLGIFSVGSYFILLYFIRLSESFSQIVSILKYLLIFLFVIYYFLLAAFAAAAQSSWKKFAASWLTISIKRISKTAVVFLSVTLALFASCAILYLVTEKTESLLLLLLSGILTILMLCVARIFWIACSQEYNKN